MKKNFKKNFLLILAIFLVPLFALTACDQTNYFVVQTKQCGTGGSINGPNEHQQIAEGQNVEVFATETTGKFICWVRNSSFVVSTEQKYNFVMSKQTEGTYTAVFGKNEQEELKEPGYEQMPYATLTNIDISSESVGANITLPYIVEIVLTPSNAQTQQRKIYSASLMQSQQLTYNGNVFSFLSTDQYVVDVNLTYMLDDQTKTDHCEMTISKDEDWKNYKNQKTTESDNGLSISLTFEKLNSNFDFSQNA